MLGNVKLNKMKSAEQRLKEISDKNKNTKEYSLGDVLLVDRYEKELKERNWHKDEIEKLSPSYYIT